MGSERDPTKAVLAPDRSITGSAEQVFLVRGELVSNLGGTPEALSEQEGMGWPITPHFQEGGLLPVTMTG